MGCAATKDAEADAARSDFSREPGLPPVHQEQLDDWMQASNLPTLTQDQLDDSMEAWNEYDGALIETELRVDEELGGSPVRLIDARFLVQLAEQGGIFIRRQDLPETAFLSLDTIKRLPKGGKSGDCLRVISISHPWQHPDHPDQKSINLKLLARVLKAFVEHRGGTYAVFLDFLSLTQKGPKGEARSKPDAALFDHALGTMMVWYSHPKILTLKLTKLPPGYPNGFTFPKGITPNTASYFDRGWCFCESSVTNMTKDFDYVLDLGKLSKSTSGLSAIVRECTAGRAPPLTPADFRVALSTKSFTSKKADEEMVARLYESTFKSQFAKAETLRYSSLSWGDAEMETFAKVVVASGALPQLMKLFLRNNQIGDVGMQALAGAVSKGALDKLRVLRLANNKIADAGLTALAKAVESGALPQLKKLSLFNNQIGDVGMQALAGAVSKGALAALETLILGGNAIGDAGMSALAKAITPGPNGKGALDHLTWLELQNNKISDAGMTAFADAVGKGALDHLTFLNLESNQIADAGLTAFAKAVESRALDHLTDLYLQNNRISDTGMMSFSDALGKGALASGARIFLGENSVNETGEQVMRDAAKTRRLNVTF